MVQTMDVRLRENLPPTTAALLRQVGALAHQQGMVAYAVGGFVRDLLLGVTTLDVDIVVEGDGPSLARELATRWNARLTIHERFLTATLEWEASDEHSAERVEGVRRLDIATARREFYPHPAALPQVEPATILDDLWRRDFSINAMAMRLDPDRFGELVDPTGGLDDLRRGVIRILNDRSFVDDPTRILRAVRYEQRFGFRMERKTLLLLCQARDESWLTHLTRDRIKQELWRILHEREPAKPLKRLRQLRLLPLIAPELRITPRRLSWLQRVDEWLSWHHQQFPDMPLEREWALLLPLLPNPQAVISFCQRYQLSERHKQSGLAFLRALRALPPCRPSRFVRWLNPLSLEATLAMAAKRANLSSGEQWRRYFLIWRRTRPDITGEDLKAHGVTGRAIALGLQAALAAKLDKGADAAEQLRCALAVVKRYCGR